MEGTEGLGVLKQMLGRWHSFHTQRMLTIRLTVCTILNRTVPFFSVSYKMVRTVSLLAT